MSAVSLESTKATDLGVIIAKVQDDLQHLRAAAARAGEGELDLQALDMAISRTEKGIQTVAERVLSVSHNHVTTLPAVTGAGRGRPHPRTRSGGERSLRELAESTARTSPMKNARAQVQRPSPPPLSSLSPGQQAQVNHLGRLLSQPTHPITRQMLVEQYGLSPPCAPALAPLRELRPLPGHLATGTTVEQLTALPRANRRNALLTPPPISEEDARRGLLSLLERGLIPPAAEIVLSPPPVQPKTAPLHSPAEQFTRQRVADGEEASTHLAGVKLAPVEPRPLAPPISIPAVERSRASSEQSKPSRGMSVKILEPPTAFFPQPKSPPSTPVRVEPAAHKIVVQNGRVVDNMAEFRAFEKAFQSNWSSIVAVLQQLEELCRNYAIPIALADGLRLLELASEHELGLKIRREDLLECLVNARDVQLLLRIPGRRYKGARGLHAAAAKIQATFRMFVKRTQYLEYRRRKWATGVITMSWLMFVKMFKVREQLKKVRACQLCNHQERAKAFRRRWEEIKQSKRVIVHLPSQGYPQPVRAGMEDLQIRQNLQMGRICDVRDPNVEVLYISPIPVDDEVQEYYQKLLAMGAGGERAMERVHFITPERTKTFVRHKMALSSVLMYSPRTLERIRHLTAGREAYIVPGVVSRDDITVADKLGLPLLGPEPEISQLYSSKPGARRIFADAKVPAPPSAGDIFSEDQLVEQLASLIANHPLTSRWLFKLPEHVGGRGFAYCDVTSHLECHEWVLRESQRYGEKWNKKWAQEYALKRILAELPGILWRYARPVDTKFFPMWQDFLECFLSQGGIIEGSPPSDSVTAVTVDALIEPNGVISILSAQDQICSDPYMVWGVSVPQTSVPPLLLIDSTHRIVNACRARGIIGHLSIDFLTFLHPNTLQQELWAVDLDIGYSDHLALLRLLSHTTGASFHWDSGRLLLPGGEPRFALLCPRLFHTNLTLLYYPIFFQMCRAHHIGYDPKEKLGTLFALVDGQHREHLATICLQPSLLKAVSSCSYNLSTIHQEISTPNMQGCSNFQAACKELDNIAELMKQNEQDEHT